MGIKNIHILLVAISFLLAVFFGIWALNNHAQAWGAGSFAAAAGLLIYGINFIKKARSL
jgi:hypothetical protein